MRGEDQRVRIVTYNVHKCRGMDRQVSVERIARVLREIEADIVALQEVLNVENGAREAAQARYLAEALGYEYCLGENRQLWGGAYGNAILSRFPIREVCNYDISWRAREQRGCLRADIALDDHHLLHIFNVHLGTSFMERRHQAQLLVESKILKNTALQGPRIMLGDFNEWTYGLTSRLLTSHLKSIDLQTHLKRSRTYPGIFPVLHLDHIYYEDTLQLERLSLHRTRTALVASDHLPLVAEFHCPPATWKKAEPAAELVAQ